MSSAYTRSRSPFVWIRYQEPGKAKPTQEATKIRVDGPGGRQGALKLGRVTLAEIERQIASGERVETGPLTLLAWVTRMSSKRPNGKDELSAIRRYAPELLDVPLTSLDSRKLIDWISRLKAARIPGRSVCKYWSHVRVYLTAAVVDKLLIGIPPLPHGTLPPKKDADPSWRGAAIFGLAECEQLMTDERIFLGRRAMYALKALTGVRHGESVGLTWSRIDWTATPLPSLSYAWQYDRKATKTGATKIVPMIPALESVIRQWLAFVTERDGRAPAPTDRIITDEVGRAFDAYSEENENLIADLETLGLRTTAGDTRRRGGHDFRRTFITELRRAKVSMTVVKSMTHPPAVVRDAVEGYDNVDYADKCDAVSRLKVRTLRAVAAPVALAAVGSGEGSAALARYTPATLAANPTELQVVQSKTVLDCGSVSLMTKGRDNGHLHAVASPDKGSKAIKTTVECSGVAATPLVLETIRELLAGHAEVSRAHLEQGERLAALAAALLAVK